MAEFTAPVEDRRKVTVRLYVLQVVISAAFVALACGFCYFQVVQNAKFVELADNNHQRTIALRAPRGVMFDRNMKVLVENRSSFTISIVREHSKNLDHTIKVLSEVAGLDERYVKDVVNRHRRDPSYQPIVVVEDASLSPGGCRIFTNSGQIDGDLDGQIDRVAADLLPEEGSEAKS